MRQGSQPCPSPVCDNTANCSEAGGECSPRQGGLAEKQGSGEEDQGQEGNGEATDKTEGQQGARKERY